MESIIISAILSGILATIITLAWQTVSRIRQEKTQIFATLMSKRYDITDEECVRALNMIDVVFYGDTAVRTAWREFKSTTDMYDSEEKSELVIDKWLKMLEKMAVCTGHKNIHWDDIKRYYYPRNLSKQKREEEILRQLQIEARRLQIEKAHGLPATPGDSNEGSKNQVLLKAMESLEGIITFATGSNPKT